MAWGRLFDAYEPALAALDRIARRLCEPWIAPPRIVDATALTTGSLGVALAHAYLADARPDADHLPQCEELLERSLQMLERPTGPSLSHGTAGLGFVAAHLDASDELVETIDDVVARLVAASEPLPFELMFGLAGFAAYARERDAQPLHAAIARRLVAIAEPANGGLRWRSAPDPRWASPEMIARDPDGWFDLGVAHGAPGAIATLAYAGERAAAVAGLEWLWELRVENDFPGAFGATDRVPLRWCYGALGIAGTLYPACRALGESAWADRCYELAVSAAREPARADELGLCHGLAGNAHIFHRLYRATNAPILRDAALRWYEALLDALASADLGGMDPGLLHGAAGIALALAAATSDAEPGWDAALLLSSPTCYTPRA